MKPSSKEDFLRQEAPIDRPLEKKYSAKIESSNDIVERVGGEERQSKHHLEKNESQTSKDQIRRKDLNTGADAQLDKGVGETEDSEVD